MSLVFFLHVCVSVCLLVCDPVYLLRLHKMGDVIVMWLDVEAKPQLMMKLQFLLNFSSFLSVPLRCQFQCTTTEHNDVYWERHRKWFWNRIIIMITHIKDSDERQWCSLQLVLSLVQHAKHHSNSAHRGLKHWIHFDSREIVAVPILSSIQLEYSMDVLKTK